MRHELGPPEPYVVNTVDGSVPGSVLQAHTIHGGVHVHHHSNEQGTGEAAPAEPTSIHPRRWITASIALVTIVVGSQYLLVSPSGLIPRCAKVQVDVTLVMADPADDTQPTKRKYRGEEVRLMVDQRTIIVGGDTYRAVVFMPGHDGRGWMPSADLGPEGACDKQYY